MDSVGCHNSYGGKGQLMMDAESRGKNRQKLDIKRHAQPLRGILHPRNSRWSSSCPHRLLGVTQSSCPLVPSPVTPLITLSHFLLLVPILIDFYPPTDLLSLCSPPKPSSPILSSILLSPSGFSLPVYAWGSSHFPPSFSSLPSLCAETPEPKWLTTFPHSPNSAESLEMQHRAEPCVLPLLTERDPVGGRHTRCLH